MIDWIKLECNRAGHTDENFIEAARFGATQLIKRLCGETPDNYYIKKFSSSHYATIWRKTSDETPKNESTIVLRNSSMICYAYYDKNGKCYMYGDDGPRSLREFWGHWCYKSEIFGSDDEFLQGIC